MPECNAFQEFPVEKFVSDRVCQTDSDSCDWKTLVRAVARHLSTEMNMEGSTNGAMTGSKAAFLTVSLLYQQTSLVYHVIKCANLEVGRIFWYLSEFFFE